MVDSEQMCSSRGAREESRTPRCTFEATNATRATGNAKEIASTETRAVSAKAWIRLETNELRASGSSFCEVSPRPGSTVGPLFTVELFDVASVSPISARVRSGHGLVDAVASSADACGASAFAHGRLRAEQLAGTDVSASCRDQCLDPACRSAEEDLE